MGEYLSRWQVDTIKMKNALLKLSYNIKNIGDTMATIKTDYLKEILAKFVEDETYFLNTKVFNPLIEKILMNFYPIGTYY